MAVAIAALAAASSPLHAQLFKCVGKDGKTSYQSEPCADTAQEQKIKTPTSPGGGSSQPLKAGWLEQEVTLIGESCAGSILIGGKRSFDAAGQAFPEAQLKAPVYRYCTCIARRAATTYTRAEFEKDPQGHGERIGEEAMRGGPCKPDGLLAEMMRKAGRMQ